MPKTKTYEWRGGLWKFTPKGAPADAVEHLPKPKPEPKAKARKSRNKARTVKNKEAVND